MTQVYQFFYQDLPQQVIPGKTKVPHISEDLADEYNRACDTDKIEII